MTLSNPTWGVRNHSSLDVARRSWRDYCVPAELWV